jgi:uncharacterized protein YndB with AHSA1/START domain
MADYGSKELNLTREFNAPIELVFKAWTNPAMLAKWWGPDGVTNPESEVDLRVGGRMYIVMLAGEELGQLAGQRWPMEAVIEEIENPHKFVFKNQAVDTMGKVLIDGRTTVSLEEVGPNKTKMTLHVTAKGMAEPAVQMLEGMTPGWTQSIDKLDNYLESLN